MTGPVLVVDDDLLIRTLVSMVLGRVGYEVHQAEDGPEGLRHLADHPDARPGLILVDTVMPGWDGYETCRRIRAATDGGEGPRPHVVLMSADPADPDAARQAGVDGFLQKPFEPADLVGFVRQAVGDPDPA